MQALRSLYLPIILIYARGNPITLTALSGTANAYLWSNGSTDSFITVNPLVNTTYGIEVVDDKNCIAFDSVTVIAGGLGAGYCNTIYVTPGGTGTGTRNDPTNLSKALWLAACKEAIIKLDTGVYICDTAITGITSNITLEGGFIRLNNWQKTSKAGATRIFRTTNNPEGIFPISALLQLIFQVKIVFGCRILPSRRRMPMFLACQYMDYT
ncbi:MAG: hypothetical protein R3B93_23940 [Bacteroidia bacterium]